MNAPDLIIGADQDHRSITATVSGVVLGPGPRTGWWLAFGVTLVGLQILFLGLAVLFSRGIGVWGVNIPVAWGFAIINLVWWIGIGHAGTLISAVLLLLEQRWRMAISRFAEAMTLFAVACAATFPVLHLGRPQVVFWLLPYPNSMAIWPQFRSPLLWDVFAISTYATISFLFWFVGLLPDLATLRDRAERRWMKLVFGVLAMGWRGSARHWHHHESASLLLAGIATPLVVSVHTVVSFDFAVSIIPGWHTTIFPPYFVAGAIYSGFAMVLSLLLPLRRVYHLHALITDRHLDVMGQVMLATGLVVAYGYLMEVFSGFYAGSEMERFLVVNRMAGPYAPFYWALIASNIVVPQLLWSRAVRRNPLTLFCLSILINTGMWLERFVIVITSLHRDFLPSSWGMYVPTRWDWAILVGMIAFFLALVLVFVRTLPMLSMFELRTLVGRGADR